MDSQPRQPQPPTRDERSLAQLTSRVRPTVPEDAADSDSRCVSSSMAPIAKAILGRLSSLSRMFVDACNACRARRWASMGPSCRSFICACVTQGLCRERRGRPFFSVLWFVVLTRMHAVHCTGKQD